MEKKPGIELARSWQWALPGCCSFAAHARPNDPLGGPLGRCPGPVVAMRADFRQPGLKEPREIKQIASDLLTQAEPAPLCDAVVIDKAEDLDLASFALLRALN